MQPRPQQHQWLPQGQDSYCIYNRRTKSSTLVLALHTSATFLSCLQTSQFISVWHVADRSQSCWGPTLSSFWCYPGLKHKRRVSGGNSQRLPGAFSKTVLVGIYFAKKDRFLWESPVLHRCSKGDGRKIYWCSQGQVLKLLLKGWSLGVVALIWL